MTTTTTTIYRNIELSLMDLIDKIRELERKALDGVLTNIEFEEEVTKVINSSKCPNCQHTHQQNTDCGVILFDGMHLMTECQCRRPKE